MEYLEYIVKQGDRWDLIAYKAYGNPLLFNGIIEANFATVIAPILEVGARLTIPVLETSNIQIDSELLPPWKR